MEDERHELRSWSIEPRDRRVHAVSPMHFQEGHILQSLLNEVRSTSSNKINVQGLFSSDLSLLLFFFFGRGWRFFFERERNGFLLFDYHIFFAF